MVEYTIQEQNRAFKLISNSMREYGVMEAFRMIMDKFDGDYSFAFFDSEDIILARDPKH